MVYPTLPLINKRIMIIDNNSQIRQLIARSLEIEGYTIQQASDASVALGLLERSVPDLILCALSLPHVSGIDFYKTLRRDRRWVIIPFIFITANESPEVIQQGREQGVEDYLARPIDNFALIKMVNTRLLRASTLKIAMIDQAYLDTVTVLANTIEGRDANTSQHVERVASLTRQLADALHWPEDNMRLLEFGARLHDIGKIVVPDHILNKPGPLTSEEWEIMKSHTTAGAKILREIKHLSGAVPYALYHHERWDGTGYPYGLKGRDIPLEGRVLALVDVFDALSTDRPYRPALPKDEVIQTLIQQSGVHFDPDLTPLFLEVINGYV